MEELENKLKAIPDSYYGFVVGIINYVKQNPCRLQKVLRFINSTKDLTSSDVVKFVSDQPDFHEFGINKAYMAG